MAVGKNQLREVFDLASRSAGNINSLDLDKFEANLTGVLDDFRNLGGVEKSLQEMDDELYSLVQPVPFGVSSLWAVTAHLLVTIFENYGNMGRGFRKAYDYTLSKRISSPIDGVFLYEELVPMILDRSWTRGANALRFFLLGQVAGFLEALDAGSRWQDSMKIEDVREAGPDILLLELARRVKSQGKGSNLAKTAKTLESRLAETDFFKDAAKTNPDLEYFFLRWGYIQKAGGWWNRILQRVRRRPDRPSGFQRIGRWRRMFILQFVYMALALILVVLSIFHWSQRQDALLQNLIERYRDVSYVQD